MSSGGTYASSLPSAVIPALEKHLRPGDEIAYAIDLCALNGSVWVYSVFAVTPRQLYSFGVKRGLRGSTIKVPVRVLGTNTSAYSSLSGVGGAESRNTLMQRLYAVTLSFVDGSRGAWQTTDLEGGRAFVAALRDAHAAASRGMSSSSVSDELARLGELKGQGLLTEQDWERAKNLFLGKAPDDRQQALMSLRQLHGLFAAGGPV